MSRYVSLGEAGRTVAAAMLLAVAVPAAAASPQWATGACVATIGTRASRDMVLLGIADAARPAFSAAMCRIAVAPHLAIVSYDIERVALPPLPQPGPDPRLPAPLILAAGKPAGRLATHVPAELPVTIRVFTAAVRGVAWPALCLIATTDAVGDPPVYPAMTWARGRYRAAPADRSCRISRGR